MVAVVVVDAAAALALLARGVLLVVVARRDDVALSFVAESLVIGSDTTCNLLLSALLLFLDGDNDSDDSEGLCMPAFLVLVVIMEEDDVKAVTMSTVERIPTNRNALEAYSTTNHNSININLVRFCIVMAEREWISFWADFQVTVSYLDVLVNGEVCDAVAVSQSLF